MEQNKLNILKNPRNSDIFVNLCDDQWCFLVGLHRFVRAVSSHFKVRRTKASSRRMVFLNKICEPSAKKIGKAPLVTTLDKMTVNTQILRNSNLSSIKKQRSCSTISAICLQDLILFFVSILFFGFYFCFFFQFFLLFCFFFVKSYNNFKK